MEQVFVDTSAWVAFVNKGDRDHRRIKQALNQPNGRLLTSNFVFDETVTFCLYRFGYETAVRVGEVLLDNDILDLIRITADDERKAWTLFLSRPDKQYSYTDCTSFILMRRFGMRQVIALDADFRQEGFELIPPS